MFRTGYIQVLYLGRAPRTKETLPDFREKCRVTQHSRAFRGLTGSQQTPGFWGVTGAKVDSLDEVDVRFSQNRPVQVVRRLNRRFTRFEGGLIGILG